MGQSRTVHYMADTTTERKEGFGLLGIGAAACVACCAPLVLAFLGGLGLASTAWIGGLGVALASAPAVGLLVVRRRRRRRKCEVVCSADGSCCGYALTAR